MTAQTIACDVSYFQKPVDDTYPHRWLIFRCCDGGFADPNCDRNAAWAAAAVASGRLDGWTAYVVYRPGKNQAVLKNVAGLPAGGYVMIDVESWRGAIKGDHSTEINQLAAELGKSRPGRVWAYGNRSDLASIYPSRGSLPVVVAAYSTIKPDVPHMIGWQYTDGVNAVPGLPTATKPFGPCDHNVLYLPAAPTAGPGPIPIPAATTTAHHLEGRVFHLIRNIDTGALRACGPGLWTALEGDTRDQTLANLALARSLPTCLDPKVEDVSNARMVWLNGFYTKGTVNL